MWRIIGSPFENADAIGTVRAVLIRAVRSTATIARAVSAFHTAPVAPVCILSIHIGLCIYRRLRPNWENPAPEHHYPYFHSADLTLKPTTLADHRFRSRRYSLAGAANFTANVPEPIHPA